MSETPEPEAPVDDSVAPQTGPAHNADTSDATQQTILDLTNSHLKDLASVAISSSLQILDLTANRLTEFDPRILALTGLVTINYRQNLLADASSWDSCSCKASLEDLELRDNNLKEIRTLAPLTSLNGSTLHELFCASNKVSEISTHVSHLTALTTLELGSNRIKAIEGISTLTNLKELWLGKNRIAVIRELGTLSLLQRISIQSNRLASMLGLEQCTSLQELYLSHNGISTIEGLDSLTNLRVLDVSSNRITQIQGLHSLSLLEDLWLNDNQIASLDEGLFAALQPVSGSLTTIYLENNPVAKEPDYREKIRATLPKLTQLDANVL